MVNLKATLSSTLIIVTTSIIAAQTTMAVAEKEIKEEPSSSVVVDQASSASDLSKVVYVDICQPKVQALASSISSHGDIAPWRETMVSAELSDVAIKEVLVDIGDTVKQGQVLARFSSDTADANIEEQRANVDVALAALYEAETNAQRARTLRKKNVLSQQQSTELLVAERSAKARLRVEKARLANAEISHKKTQLIAPYDGVIMSRSARIGAVVSSGDELFRLIRDNRLEWRAEVTPEQLNAIIPGQKVDISINSMNHITGTVRLLSPVVNAETRTGIVFVDLPPTASVRAGMFVAGKIMLDHSASVLLPQSSVIIREGISYAFLLEKNNTVTERRIKTGKRVDNYIAVINGIHETDIVVSRGAGFLSNGERIGLVKPISDAEKC